MASNNSRNRALYKMKKKLLASFLSGLIAVNAWAAVISQSNSREVPEGTKLIDNQESIIEKLIVVSGLKITLDQMQRQVTPKFSNTAASSDGSGAYQQEVMKLYAEAYPKDGFLNRVNTSLHNYYDEKRFLHYIQLLSTPTSTRMIGLESTEPTEADIKNYLAYIGSHPLSARRIKLIERLDLATGSSRLLTTITTLSIESNAVAMSEDCIVNVQRIRKEIEKNRHDIEKATRNQSLMNLAYTYRDVSDADLDEYVKTHEEKDIKWLDEIIVKAIAKQFESGMKKVGLGMKEIVQSQKPKKTMFAPKCASNESTHEELPKSHPTAQSINSPVESDLRDCLKLEDSLKIIACTENADKSR